MICNMLQWSVSPLHFQCWQSGLKIATIFRSKGHLKPPPTLGWMWMWTQSFSATALFLKHAFSERNIPDLKLTSSKLGEWIHQLTRRLGPSCPSRLSRWSPSLISVPMAFHRLELRMGKFGTWCARPSNFEIKSLLKDAELLGKVGGSGDFFWGNKCDNGDWWLTVFFRN